MKKLIALFLLMSLLVPAAMAEEAIVPALTGTPLAIDPTVGGNPADESGYILDENGNKTGYEDASLRIIMETIELENILYRVARVEVADASQLRTGLEDPSRAKKSNYLHNIAQDYNAVLAISADQIVRNNKGYVIREGKTYRKDYYKSRDILAIDANGDFHIVYKSSENELTALRENPECPIVNTFNFGPALVAEGQVLEIPSYYNTQFNLGRPEPRCAIGQTGPLSYVLVVAEGRSDDSKGATGAQLAAFMAAQGCVTAYNLDGGDTAMMWFGGDYYSAKTKRTQSDIIYFGSAVPTEE